MSLPPRRDLQRKFWFLIRAGQLRTEAAATLGFNRHTGERWFGQAGGVAPSFVQAKRGSRYLSLEEREEIFVGVQRGSSIRFIARSLGRAPSTVLRELRRNMRQQYRTRSRLEGRPGSHRTRPWEYRPILPSAEPTSWLHGPSWPGWRQTQNCETWSKPNCGRSSARNR